MGGFSYNSNADATTSSTGVVAELTVDSPVNADTNLEIELFSLAFIPNLDGELLRISAQHNKSGSFVPVMVKKLIGDSYSLFVTFTMSGTLLTSVFLDMPASDAGGDYTLHLLFEVPGVTPAILLTEVVTVDDTP